MSLAEMAAEFGYATDGGNQHVALPFKVGVAKTPVPERIVRGGRLAVSQTGHVAGMLLREYDRNVHGTFGAGTDPRVAVWTMDDDQLIGLIKVATDALAIRRKIRGR